MRKMFLVGWAAPVVYWLADHALILLNEPSNFIRNRRLPSPRGTSGGSYGIDIAAREALMKKGSAQGYRSSTPSFVATA
jgi:hypothetical protein